MDENYYPEVMDWFMKVMQLPSMYYGLIPISDLYRVFQNAAPVIPPVSELTEEEFGNLVRAFCEKVVADVPGEDGKKEHMSYALLVGNRVASTLMSETQLRDLRKERREYVVGTYILPYDDVVALIENGYIPTDASRNMKELLHTKWRVPGAEAEMMVREISNMCLMNLAVSPPLQRIMDYMLPIVRKRLGDQANTFMTQENLMELIDSMLAVYSNTGGYKRGGWPPAKLHEAMYGKGGKMPIRSMEDVVLRPASPAMMSYMKEHEAELREMGINMDLKPRRHRP